MTGEHRQLVKQLVNEAVRQRHRVGALPICLYCDQEFTPSKGANGTQRFCNGTHRRSYWRLRTDTGRARRKEQQQRQTQRRRDRRAQQAAA